MQGKYVLCDNAHHSRPMLTPPAAAAWLTRTPSPPLAPTATTATLRRAPDTATGSWGSPPRCCRHRRPCPLLRLPLLPAESRYHRWRRSRRPCLPPPLLLLEVGSRSHRCRRCWRPCPPLLVLLLGAGAQGHCCRHGRRLPSCLLACLPAQRHARLPAGKKDISREARDRR